MLLNWNTKYEYVGFPNVYIRIQCNPTRILKGVFHKLIKNKYGMAKD